MDESTVPREVSAQPVRSVRVRVLDGDAGAALENDVVTIGSAQGNTLVLADPMVSRYHLELHRVPAGIEVRDLGSTNGTSIGGVLIRDAIATAPPGTTLTIGETRIALEDGPFVVRPLASSGTTVAGLVGRSRVMRKLVAEVESVAQSEVSVLLVGESGTGKELVARALHDLGPRRDGPFVTVDGAALVPTLFASELFGHERGAFTGADRRHAGAFERARGGTLFLDEIGELPSVVQGGLLGALERRVFRPVGSPTEIGVDVRVVAATHRDLRSAVNTGAFRLDLYYRLAVMTLDLPPLRSRAGDVPMLVEHFVREAGYDGPIERLFPAEVLAELAAHTWPGNVRELRNFVERTLIVGTAPRAPSAPAASGDVVSPLLDLKYREARRSLLDEFERRYLTRLLERTKGNVRAAAREAALDRTYLTELLKRHGLK